MMRFLAIMTLLGCSVTVGVLVHFHKYDTAVGLALATMVIAISTNWRDEN